MALADAGSAADTLAGVAVTLSGRCGQRRRGLTVSVAVSVADVGSGAEAIALLTRGNQTDCRCAAPVHMVLPPGVSLTVVDSGAGVDASGVAVTPP